MSTPMDLVANPRDGWMQTSLSADELPAPSGEQYAVTRIWLGFMTARAMVAMLLLALQGLGLYFRGNDPGWLVVLCAAYVAATLATRLALKAVQPGKPFERYWPATLGMDLAVYFLLVWFGRSEMANYIPLLALPPVICAVLGTWRLTWGTVIAASVLIGLSSMRHYRGQDADSQIMHYAMVALYVLAMMLLASMLHRVARNYGVQQLKSYSSQRLARLQGRIQDMVVQSVRDGVLVVGNTGRLRAINQAAQDMLHISGHTPLPGLPIAAIAEMAPLQHLIRQSFDDGEGVSSEVLLFPTAERATHLMVRTRLSPPEADAADETLCLLYLQDMQEVQQQVRTEKLAAMGRMSAAVAHEIRNPLSAIGQAAQLLDEELDQPIQKKLNGMVQTNALRLGRIVSDVLDIAKMQQQPLADAPLLPLDATVQQLCDEWLQHNAAPAQLRMALQLPDVWVRFDPEHLRRVMVNLLDNAVRHAQQGPTASVAITTRMQDGVARLQVWSRGAPLPDAVQARLFEPFAAGPSRSTGLGLYICRELCQRYHADIHYHRLPQDAPTPQDDQPGTEEGNAFAVLMPVANPPASAPPKENPLP